MNLFSHSRYFHRHTYRVQDICHTHPPADRFPYSARLQAYQIQNPPWLCHHNDQPEYIPRHPLTLLLLKVPCNNYLLFPVFLREKYNTYSRPEQQVKHHLCLRCPIPYPDPYKYHLLYTLLLYLPHTNHPLYDQI